MPKRLSGRKHINDLVKIARRQGWQVRKNTNTHWIFRPPDREMQIVVCGQQPTDFRAIHNMIHHLRRNGLVI